MVTTIDIDLSTEMARLRLPATVASRLQSLLDRQAGKKLACPLSVTVRKCTKVTASGPCCVEEHSCRPQCPSPCAEGVWDDKTEIICDDDWQRAAEKVVHSLTVTSSPPAAIQT